MYHTVLRTVNVLIKVYFKTICTELKSPHNVSNISSTNIVQSAENRPA